MQKILAFGLAVAFAIFTGAEVVMAEKGEPLTVDSFGPLTLNELVEVMPNNSTLTYGGITISKAESPTNTANIQDTEEECPLGLGKCPSGTPPGCVPIANCR